MPGTFWPREPRPHHSDLQTLWYKQTGERECLLYYLVKEIFSNSVWIVSSSGGQKARVVFAELACRQPDVLILVSIVRSFALPRDEHFLLSC